MRKRIILASASPRREELLKLIGLKFKVKGRAEKKERVSTGKMPEHLVQDLALQKAKEVATKLKRGLIIGADTVVVLKLKGPREEILGKPQDAEEAKSMLRRLSGIVHEVVTGIALVDAESGQELVETEKTRVKMKRLTEEEITDYVATGEPLDKAGAYAIQGKGAIFIEGIEGCYYNVVGLPLAKLAAMLQNFGIKVI